MGFALLILSQFSKISHENETKLFHFHRIFKNGGGEGIEPPEPTLDPSLIFTLNFEQSNATKC